MTTAMVKRIGLFGGPLLGLLCYYLLPPHYATDPGEWVEFTRGRATLALMVWMAGWWLTEAVDIEATALLPIVTFPLLGIAPQQSPAALRRGGDFPLHGRLHHRACHRALGSRPTHRLLHLAPGRGASGRDRRRLHGGHRVPEHGSRIPRARP